jgi:predicted alpha/beta hydrolase family esterase
MRPLYFHHLALKIVPLLICLGLLSGMPSRLFAAEESPEVDSLEVDSLEAPLHYLPNLSKKRAQSLIRYLELMDRENEVVYLSGTNQDHYGLFLDEFTGSPQGGVLILHNNQHGHWPDIITPLREYLPQYGWATLAVELPDEPARQRIARTTLTDQPSPPDSEEESEEESESITSIDPITLNQEGEPLLATETIDNARTNVQASLSEEAITLVPVEQYKKKNQQRISAAMEYLRSKGQLNIVIIGHGIGAAWAIDYLAQENTKGLTLVTIDAMPSQHNDTQMHQQLVELQIPFLDLIQTKKAYVLKNGNARRAIMQRNKNKEYQQIITSNMASYRNNENPTTRRIRGWLKTNAGGELVKINP